MLQHGDLAIGQLDQVTQALHSDPVGVTQTDVVEQRLATDAEQVAHGHPDTLLGQHRMDLGLEVRAQVDELAPVADELADLSELWRGDPGLGQASHAEQIDQVGGVVLVVLHPPVAPVVPQRVGQVDRGAALLEDVSRPVPAIGGLEDHLRVLSGLGQLDGQGLGVVVDADRLEGLARLSSPDDDAASSVQIDADILLFVFHGSLLPSSPGWFRNPKCASHTWSGSTGGLPWELGFRRAGPDDAASCHLTAPRDWRPARCASPCPSRWSCAALLHHISEQGHLMMRPELRVGWGVAAIGSASSSRSIRSTMTFWGMTQLQRTSTRR